MNSIFSKHKRMALPKQIFFITRALLGCIVLTLSFSITQLQAFSFGPDLDESYIGPRFVQLVQDTIPLRDTDSDFINNSYYNPFDITPSSITQEVEYDPATNSYITIEKIGEEYYRNPSFYTFEEYLDIKGKEQERQYFNKLAGINSGIKSGSGKVDPMSKVNIENNLIDRLFGGSEVSIVPQGNIDITFGLDYQKIDNPTITSNQNQQGPFFDFDMDIKMNVEGGIGKKLNLGFNYDTQATFDFDRKIKIAYDTGAFSEDDIIKSIEAGNVSMPLNSQLIQGSESLFGLKTELQFGHLRLTLLASQSKSKQEELVIEGGAVVQDYEVRPDEYDENRHFFLTHYHRAKFEESLENLPFVNSQMAINRIQVWITENNDRNVEDTRIVCAFSDLSKSDLDLYDNKETLFPPNTFFGPVDRDIDGLVLPQNENNELYEKLSNDQNTRIQSRTSQGLRSGAYGMTETKDFELFRARKLNSSEYSYNEQLGFISLNVRLRPNQVLAVAFEYNYTYNGDKVYKVGEITEDANSSSTDSNAEPQPDNVIYLKMLKSSNQRVALPSWDLMMKNVYPLGTAQLGQEDFVFDIFYEDNTDGSIKRFIPEDGFRFRPLLDVFQLDRLNARLDPQPDGIFDFVSGITVIPRSGTIIFPVLEPFGKSLSDLIGDPQIAEKYEYTELYDSTITQARIVLEKNRFVMKGQYKSSISSEISLGAFNIPQGSVTVRAGGKILVEGQDYDIDYGIGRLKIINDAYLQSGTPIKVSFEDQSLFSLQQKNMFGIRANYEFSEKLNVGATYLRLSERPFTEKVNFGDDPINNRMFGLDMNYSSESEWVTKVVDKLPFYSTNAPSSISFNAEVAALKPGHAGAINLNDSDGGVVSLDDFEGAGSSIPLGNQPNQWIHSSTPLTGTLNGQRRQEALLDDDLAYGANRARLSWYRIDQIARSDEDRSDPYTRAIVQDELFDRDIPLDQLPDLFTFDLSYYPEERGPYNFDVPGGYPGISSGVSIDNNVQDLTLNDPETRWAGIMRGLNNNDFEQANIEYIEFWLLNPYMDRRNPDENPVPGEQGKLFFHLGNVSEDVLKDNLQFYENAIPVDENTQVPSSQSVWADVPIQTPPVIAFDNSSENRKKQDVGYDGLDNIGEGAKFAEYIQAVTSLGPLPGVQNDPANDDYTFYNDPVYNGINELIYRYRDFNNPQGNLPDNTGTDSAGLGIRGNPEPQVEDLNDNRSLETSESYYEYEVDLTNFAGEIDQSTNEFIREIKTISNTNGQQEKWYRFQIPINRGKAVNGIEGLRSIQFMRMHLTGFQKPKTLRFAELELVRNQWRRQPVECNAQGIDVDLEDLTKFSIDDVGVQENSAKLPFNYKSPPNIKQQRLFSTFANVLQDEKSLALKFDDMSSSCDISVFKFTNVDLRLYEKLQMFVHAEEDSTKNKNWEDGDLFVYIKIGKDFVSNYYEYQIPLRKSDDSSMQLLSDADNIWKKENMFDFPLTMFTDLKIERNIAASQAVPTASAAEIFGAAVPADEFITDGLLDSIKIIGNPSLGYVKGIEIGIRAKSQLPVEKYSGEVWVNELRATGLQERGGVAGLARLDIQMADLGAITASGGYSSVGFGAINDKLADRAQEANIDYDIAANLELGKMLPAGWNLSIPFFAQYSKSIIKPQFDPFELDLTTEQTIMSRTNENPDSIRDRANEETSIKTFNFTNVRKNRGSGNNKSSASNQAGSKSSVTASKPKDNKPSTPKPWDIENVSVSYAYTETNHKDPLFIQDKTRDYRGSLDYNYSRKSNFITPFKKLKGNWLKLISEFNFNPIPQSFTFSTEMRRFKNERVYRLPDVPVYAFDDLRFDWTRNYGLNWDLSKSLKFNFNASNNAIIDELRQTGVPFNSNDPRDPNSRDWIDENGTDVTDDVRSNPDLPSSYRRDNIMQGGRNKQYTHDLSLTYTLPFKHVPLLDFITTKATYDAGYGWDAPPLGNQEFGSVIQNNQSRSISANMNFTKLYSKSKYLKSIESGRSSKPKRSRSRNNDDTMGTGKDELKAADGDDKAAGEDDKKSRSKDKNTGPSLIERVLIRPMLTLRSAKFNYKESFSTVVPGFTLTPDLLGLSSGFDAPGTAFVVGLQPDIDPANSNNWLYQAVDGDRNWITDNALFNSQVLQNRTLNWDAKIDLEPFKDFKLDILFKKSYRTDHTENFRYIDRQVGDLDIGFHQLAQRDIGSFEVTYSALNTLFGTDSFELFKKMKANRFVISQRLSQRDNNGLNGQDHTENIGFKEGYGGSSSSVVIPAFLAAYTGKDVNDLDYSEANIDLEKQIGNNNFIPKPNWNLSYRGLSKLAVFKDVFSSIEITHGYKSTLTVNNFFSDLEYDPTADLLKPNGNYYSRIEIPQVVIDEQFQPILGVSVKTKSDMNIDFEYRKSRRLGLILETTNLEERKSTELTLGFGYTFPDINIKFLTGDRGKNRTRKDRDADKDADDDPDSVSKDKNSRNNRNTQGRGGSVNNFRGRELTLTFDLSFGDDITILHELDNEIPPQASRGTKSLRISPSVDYDINENLTLRAFFDYSSNKPYLSSSFPVTSMQGGVTVRFNLN